MTIEKEMSFTIIMKLVIKNNIVGIYCKAEKSWESGNDIYNNVNEDSNDVGGDPMTSTEMILMNIRRK